MQRSCSALSLRASSVLVLVVEGWEKVLGVGRMGSSAALAPVTELRVVDGASLGSESVQQSSKICIVSTLWLSCGGGEEALSGSRWETPVAGSPRHALYAWCALLHLEVSLRTTHR